MMRRIVTNFIFYSRFAVHNILQYYLGTGEDDKNSGSIPGDTRISIFQFIPKSMLEQSVFRTDRDMDIDTGKDTRQRGLNISRPRHVLEYSDTGYQMSVQF
jgi:hypothetical protein